MDQTPPNDLEYPDECGECGFEPDTPDVLAGSGPEEAAEEIKDLELWRTTTTTSSDGEFSTVVRCPECGTTVVEIPIPEEVL